MTQSGFVNCQFVAGIDQGTTSSRFIIFDKFANSVASHQIEFKQIYPRPGWHEHDPLEILESVKECVEVAIKEFIEKGHSVQEIISIGITNQRETTVLWNKDTGKPVYNAIVWTDTRNSNLVNQVKQSLGAEEVFKKSGLPIATYFAALKARWILENVPQAKALYDQRKLMFGTIDSWLVYNLTGSTNGGLHITDSTNASRTMLMNINTLKYDDWLIKFFGMEKLILPEIRTSSEIYGQIKDGSLAGVSISGILGDQSAALVGQGAFERGGAKNTYGTGCFLLYNTGDKAVLSENGLLTTVAYHFKGQKPMYALEGSVAVAGSAIKWLRDGLGLIKSSDEVGREAGKVKDTGGVVFVTAFSGLFAPYWLQNARGTIVGITGYTTKSHICRATLEACCFQTKAILDAMERDSKVAMKKLRVDGGMTQSDVCMQIQADLLGIVVERPRLQETTTFGACIASGLATGLWKDICELVSIHDEGMSHFNSQITLEQREAKQRRWECAIQSANGCANLDERDSEVNGSS